MACKCLNVRIRPQPEHSRPPDFLIANIGLPDYTLTYVGEHGLTIEHPQVTVRTRKIGQPMPDSPRSIRYTTLTCLICQTLAYRVQQLVTLDVDGQEGPLLPSSDWVEQETLKSSHGWIEVYKDCLASNAIPTVASSSDFSPEFHIAVPQPATPSPAEPASEESPDSPDHSQYDAPAGPFLTNLKALFPPAPFVPLHPVFSHLLSAAEGRSETLRAEAEKQIAAIIREKVAELQVAEDKLRRDVNPPSSSPYSSHRSSSLDSLSGRSPPTEIESPGPSPRASRDTIIQPFKRKMDEQQDTTVSFRYFTIVEAEAARKRQQQQQSAAADVAGAEDRKRTAEKPGEKSGDTKGRKSPGHNEISTTEHRVKEERAKKSDGEESKAPPEMTTPKSKRRVTFDLQVEADDANENTNKSSSGEKSWADMIFDLEDEVESGEREVPETTQVPWLVDNTPTSSRPEQSHSGSRDGPSTSSSLRRTSVPSIPLAKTNGGAGGRSVRANGVLDVVAPLSPPEPQKPEQSDEVDPHEEDILRLVAAHTPSHRNAWKRHSKAWKALVGSSYLKGAPGALIPKEDEDDSERTPNETDDSDLDALQDVKWSFQGGIAASLPVNIRPLVRRREPLSLASYQPKTSLPEKAGAMGPSLPDASSGRHVSFAERDPTTRRGTLDFISTVETEEDEEGSDEEPTQVSIPDEARGRQRAFKILKARSKVPAAGMWRSLA
ncbi:hypothetical protein BKA82DRAFT_12669 [Pisolithus tinctorius]|nr:hypothetical protein BKA82DRAFT_12669 [Pisolithus tinctorius]